MIDLLCELVPNNFWGVAVNRLKVKRQSSKIKENQSNANDLGMAAGRTFKFMKQMRLNQGIKAPILIGFL